MKAPPAASHTHQQGHRERLRARLNDAPEKLVDYEVLELLLGYVFLRRDTKPLAKDLLARFGSLRGVMDARPQELTTVPGVGPAVENFWKLLREFMARYAESPIRTREALCAPGVIAQMARQRLGRLPHEELWLAFVDTKNRLLSWEKAQQGTINAAMLYPRDVMERALSLKASGFFLVHNHPGGDPSPSGADMELTQRLQRAAQSLAIRFIDHVIVTDNQCYSLMSDGFL